MESGSEIMEAIEKLWKQNYPAETRREINIPERTVYSLIEESAKVHPNNIALDFFGKKTTYAKLKKSIDNAANYLSEIGIKTYDRVGLMLPNSPQFVILFFAIVKIGAIVVQVNPLYTTFELRDQFTDSTTNTVIILDDFYPKVEPLVPSVIKKIIVTKMENYLSGFLSVMYSLSRSAGGKKIKIPNGDTIYRFNPKTQSKKKVPEQKIDPKIMPALIQYTGGTTGIPKGALLSHYNLIANVYQLSEWLPKNMRVNRTFLSAIPFFHVYGMMTAMLIPSYLGSRMTIVPDPRDTRRVLKTIQNGKSIIFPGIPTMYHSILNYKNSSKYNIKAIDLLLSGAAPLPMEIQKEFEVRTGASLLEGYGLTEASPVVCATPVEVEKRKAGSVGFPVPNTIVKIVDEDKGNDEKAIGEIGELIVKGPQVMLGYLNNVEETKSTIRDGWLYTGDLAMIDNEGYIHIVDRKKDLIIAGGYNVYPREVEEILYRNPKIEDVAVVGVSDPHRGETVKAVIVLKKGETLTREEIMQYCNTHLAVYKIPRLIEFRETLPRSVVGKVLKKELRN
ncbi:MAG: long-chain-fatty-acid--CoA ligase [Thermoplasmataceae archaeon]